MSFQENLDTLPSINHLSGLDIKDDQGLIVHHIPAQAGKLGSLRVYYALAAKFHHILDKPAAQHGLSLFAEHVEDARLNPGKHPNIDLLLSVIEHQKHYQLIPIETNVPD